MFFCEILHRFYIFFALFIYAKKCEIPRKSLRKTKGSFRSLETLMKLPTNELKAINRILVGVATFSLTLK